MHRKKELRFNQIWLMPIMSSPSYHKYDVTDYKNMDEIRVSIEAVNTAVEESANAIAEVSEDTTNITGRVDDIQEKRIGK